MRSVTGLPLLCVLSSTAAAEVVPVRPFTVALSFTAHGGAIDGVPEGGVGPTAELAYGWNRTQLFVEGGIAWVSRGPSAARESGTQLRAALGARWIARSFDIEKVGIDMTLDATAGAHEIWFDGGDTIMRPEIAGGFGIQVRKYRRPHAALRFSFRMYWAPHDRDTTATTTTTTTTRTTSPTPATPLTNGGFMALIGVAL